MTIIYRDEIGVVCQEIENNEDCSVSFLEGKAYFTSNGTDFRIEVSSIIKITRGCRKSKDFATAPLCIVIASLGLDSKVVIVWYFI